MFNKNKKKQKYTNELTELILNDKNIAVEKVFSHELLSITIRNEAADFMEYIFPADQMEEKNPDLPNFDLVIEYALTNKEYKFEDDKNTNPLTFIIGRNATNFLASPGKKLNEFGNNDSNKRIFKALRNFITTEDATNSMCAGNFSRIFSTWYSRNPEQFGNEEEIQNFYNDKFSIDKLIEFCVLNIKELCYAELLERFLTTEFDDEESQNKIRTKILYEILQKVRDVIEEKLVVNEMTDSKNSMTILQKENLIRNLSFTKSDPQNDSNDDNMPVKLFSATMKPNKKTVKPESKKATSIDDQGLDKYKKELNETGFQPYTWKVKEIPLPKYFTAKTIKPILPIVINNDDNNSKHQQKTKIKSTDLIPIVDNEIKWKEDEKKLFAYTLINVIWTAATESSTIFEFIQSQQPEKPFEERKRILEYLLFIGVFGYENIMVSSTAFRILDVVVNGDPKLDINPLSKKDRLGSNDVDLIYNYADLVVFDTDNVSNLSIFSFPIFYDHVYSNLKAEQDSIVEYKFIDLKSRYIHQKKKVRSHITNNKGLAPFIYLLPVVLTDPPLSSELCYSYSKIIDRICNERKELLEKIRDGIDDNQELKDTINRIEDIDDFYLDFITYKFEYEGLKGRFNIFELIEEIFPLNPHFYTRTTSRMTDKLKEIKLSEAKLAVINHHSETAHPLTNPTILKITNTMLSRDNFLNSDDGFLISTKNENPLPHYKEEGDQGQFLIDLYSSEYNEIINESRLNKMKAGPRDENKELNGS